MYKVDSFTIERWVQEVFKLNQEYYDLIQAGIKQQLNPPAKESEIAAFEKRLGQRLPLSYRIFLSLHNGWQHWEGDTHLISIEQQQRGEYAEWIQKLRRESWDEGNSAAMDGIFIGVQLNSVGGFVVDTSKVDDRGEMEIINLEYSEVARYSDFIDLLQQTAEDTKTLIQEEKEFKEE